VAEQEAEVPANVGYKRVQVVNDVLRRVIDKFKHNKRIKLIFMRKKQKKNCGVEMELKFLLTDTHTPLQTLMQMHRPTIYQISNIQYYR
jgi:hypothetical protein